MRSIILAAALTFAVSAQAEESCRLVRVAALEITLDQYGRPTVPVTIEGHPTRMVVDTGAAFSGISPEWIAQNGIRVESLSGNAVRLFGGYRLGNVARVQTFQLGKLSTGHMSFLVFPPSHFEPGVAGLIGAEVLRSYDVDFDFAAARLNLFRKNDCGEKVIYWPAQAFAVASLHPTDDDHLVIDARLDGRDIRVTIDTGASDSLLDLERARGIFDWDSNTPLTSAGTDAYHFPFKALSFDAVEVSNPAITLMPESRIGFGYNAKQPPLLLGMNVLRHLHMYVSYDQRKVYFTPASAP
jgi:predicted aspartyl protease